MRWIVIMPSELKTVCIQMMDDGLLEPDLEAKLKRAFNKAV